MRVISDWMRDRMVASLTLCQSDEMLWNRVRPMLNRVSRDGVFTMEAAEANLNLAWATLHICLAGLCLHHAAVDVGPESVADHLTDQLARLPVAGERQEVRDLVAEVIAHDPLHYALLRVGTVAELMTERHAAVK